MARPLRLDYSDKNYHVLSRGNEKREIFQGEKDYRKFLDILGRTVARSRVEIHAYVLMKNHYHLLLHTQDAILSRAIQWLGSQLFHLVQSCPRAERTSLSGPFQELSGRG